MAAKRKTKRKSSNPVLKAPKGKFIPASAVRFNRNGTVTVKVPGRSRRTNTRKAKRR